MLTLQRCVFECTANDWQTSASPLTCFSSFICVSLVRNPESTATAEEPVEDADEDQVVEETLSFQAPAPITVTAALSMFGLDEFIEKFEAEKIDLESFVSPVT